MYISVLALIAWIAAFNIIGCIMVMKDKQRARQGRRRIPERRLMWMGALGGAMLMWLTMILIHHKTHRKKFMVGLPIMLAVQIALILLAWENGQYFIFVWSAFYNEIM